MSCITQSHYNLDKYFTIPHKTIGECKNTIMFSNLPQKNEKILTYIPCNIGGMEILFPRKNTVFYSNLTQQHGK